MLDRDSLLGCLRDNGTASKLELLSLALDSFLPLSEVGEVSSFWVEYLLLEDVSPSLDEGPRPYFSANSRLRCSLYLAMRAARDSESSDSDPLWSALARLSLTDVGGVAMARAPYELVLEAASPLLVDSGRLTRYLSRIAFTGFESPDVDAI